MGPPCPGGRHGVNRVRRRMGHDGEMADQLPPCTFVVVSGPSASGKTTLARAIAPALGGVAT